jgi:Dullard-like phosphatase family protein
MLLHVSVTTPSLISVVAATQRRLTSSVAANVVAEQISGRQRCNSNSNNRYQRRPQGGIASTATLGALSTRRWASTMTRPSRQQVHPSLRKRRPLVNGEPVAFHMKDLVSTSLFSDSSSSSQDSTGTTRSNSSSSSSTKRAYESDLIVVLDMDECLIHSKFLSSPAAAQVYAHQVRRQHNHEHGTSESADAQEDGSIRLASTKIVDSFNVTLPDGDLVHVNVRPGLHDFLEQVTTKYETHIFTAAMEVYAKPVLDQLDPTGTKFAGRWYRESCQSCPEHGAYIKNLLNLQHAVRTGDMERIVLVDNNPLSFLAQPENGILVSNFYNDPTDSTLPAVWQLLQELDECPDVRPILQERFRLKEALAELDAAARVA